MKPLVCELCGSNEILKQDGYFVCQHCSTKYTVEEAKKLMVEGTVKIDETDRTDNLYKIARQAKAEGNIKQAAQYYNELSMLKPEDWESNFYSVYYQALDCKVGQVGQVATTINNRATSTLKALKNTYSLDEAKPFVSEIVLAVINAGTSIYKTARNYQLNTKSLQADSSARGWMTSNFNLLMNIGQIVESDFGYKELAIELYKKAYLYGLFTTNIGSSTMGANAIKRIDPSFDFKAFDKANKSGGCYVATAVYGSYDCPEVWTLRRFRDNTLAKSLFGRLFIYLYYAISPTLVKWFGETEWFKNMWKPMLDKKVKKLNLNGVENTPYNDRQW